jgi:Protein of unknown function (DUF2934)
MGGGQARSPRKKTKSEKPENPPVRRQSVPREAVASGIVDVTPDERHRMIAEAAYHRAEKRGFTNGDPMQDWLEAEAQIEDELRNGRTSRRV